jgi:hypothetical protein
MSNIEALDSDIRVPGVELTATSLSFSRGAPDKTEWLEVGKRIFTVHSAVQWWIGDWLNEGEVFYAGTQGGNIHYTQLDGDTIHHNYKGQDVRSPETEALNLVTGYSRDTLLEFKRVARIFEKPIRIGTLSWGHHQVVASFPTAEARQAALEFADQYRAPDKMSVAQFRIYVRRFYPDGTYTPRPNWHLAAEKVPTPKANNALRDALDFINSLSAKIPSDADAEVFYHRLIEELQKMLGAAKTGIIISPAIGPLPNAEVYVGYLQRGKKYAVEVLAPGGMGASKGSTVTAKLKKYFLISAGAEDLLNITVPQWEALWATLDAVAKQGNEKAVAAVEAKVSKRYGEQ